MISIITPVHPSSLPFLTECADSLIRQTDQNFEWIVLANGGVTEKDVLATMVHSVPKSMFLSVIETGEGHGTIGWLKGECCAKAKGDVIIELDADDLLLPNAVERIAATFAQYDVQFVYTDCVEFNADWSPHTYSGYWGWQSYPFVYHHIDGVAHPLIAMKAFPPDVNTMRRVEWAPNHIRAWRTAAYRELGGHNAALKTGDDHELVCRFFAKYGPAGFLCLNEVLYAYRVHPQNSSVTHNSDVQLQVAKNYDLYYEPMALRWASQLGLTALDLGGRFNSPVFGSGLRYTTVDRMDADVCCDLASLPWPFDDSSVGVLRAYHTLEHLRDPISTMNEAYRVLAPGGVFFIEVPSTDGRGAWQDPTHVSFWNENSFWYYTRSSHAKYIGPEYKGRFQASRVENRNWGNGIVVTRAELICIKDGYCTGGEVLI